MAIHGHPKPDSSRAGAGIPVENRLDFLTAAAIVNTDVGRDAKGFLTKAVFGLEW
jgi:hypothetical protein